MSGEANTEWNTPRTAEEVIEELDDIMFPERELDNAELRGGENMAVSDAYEYFRQKFEEEGWEGWEEYEKYYQEYLSVPPQIMGSVNDSLHYKQEMLDLRMELYGIEEDYDIRDNPAIVAATEREVRRAGEKQHSTWAAIGAYVEYEENCRKGSAGEIEENMEEAAAAEEKARFKNEQQQMIKRLQDKAKGGGLEYLVRGAPIMCICGSHSRHLDMYKSHGIYVNGKAVAFEGDCAKDRNISYFGHCNSPLCDLTEEISLKMGAAVNVDGTYLAEPDDAVKIGIKCEPDIEGRWQNTHDETKIAVDGAQEMFEGGFTEYRKALTTASYLLCRHGGLIFPLASGQVDEAFYQAPFQMYPFRDIGSDAFYAWCEKEGICPYVPGTADFYDYYREKIDTAMAKVEEIENKKGIWQYQIPTSAAMAGAVGAEGMTAALARYMWEAREAYKECLENAYGKGLDTMSGEERNKIIALKEEYLDSGLLGNREREEAEERYGGLRLPYGDNGIRAKEGYTYEDNKLYSNALEEMEALKEAAEKLGEPKAPTTAIYSPQYAQDSQEAAKRGTIRREADKVYEEFLREIATYGPGYEGLDEQKREAAEEVLAVYAEIKGLEECPDLKEVIEKYQR